MEKAEVYQNPIVQFPLSLSYPVTESVIIAKTDSKKEKIQIPNAQNQECLSTLYSILLYQVPLQPSTNPPPSTILSSPFQNKSQPDLNNTATMSWWLKQRVEKEWPIANSSALLLYLKSKTTVTPNSWSSSAWLMYTSGFLSVLFPAAPPPKS